MEKNKLFLGIFLCGLFAFSYAGDEVVTKEELMLYQIHVLEVEELLKECLVRHALSKAPKDQIPAEYKKLIDYLEAVAGAGKANKVLKEFSEAMREAPGMSTTTKVLIGGAVVVGSGIAVTGAVFIAPLVLPAAIIAKATAAVVTIKAAAVAGVAKTTAVIAAKSAVIKAVAGVSVKTFGPAIAISYAQHSIKPFLQMVAGETAEQKLKRLQKLKRDRPLKVRLKEAFAQQQKQ